MRATRFAFGIMTFLALLAGPAVAAPEAGDDAARRLEVAKQLMQSDGLAKAQDQILDMIGTQVTNILVGKNAAKEKEIRALMETVLAEMKVRKSEINEQIAGVYARHFTTQEMGEIIAFRQTPIGQKMEREMPSVMQESMQLGQIWGQQLGMKIIQQFKEEAKKRGLEL